MRIENTTRGPITIPLLDKDKKQVVKEGKPEVVTFGSRDDHKIVGVTQPIQDVPNDAWKFAKAHPAVAEMVERGDLREISA